MAIKYYDDLLVGKLKKWIPSNSNLRVLKPDETKRFFELNAYDNNDKPFSLPMVAVSRNNDIELLLNIKNPRSFQGLKIEQSELQTGVMNVIPIKVQYQIDIYTKTAEEGDDYIREYLFKLINNPAMVLEIPYNNGRRAEQLMHIANLRVLNSISDTSSISERIFSGQFTRWTIQLELQDAFLFNIPYKRNWKLYVSDSDVLPAEEMSTLEADENLTDPDPQMADELAFNMQKI